MNYTREDVIYSWIMSKDEIDWLWLFLWLNNNFDQILGWSPTFDFSGLKDFEELVFFPLYMAGTWTYLCIFESCLEDNTWWRCLSPCKLKSENRDSKTCAEC